jgi:glycine dehydrogenase subunit 1
MKFLPVSEADRKDMLAAIGAPSVDSLFASIPSEVRREPGLPSPLSEIEIRRFMGRPAPNLILRWRP